MQPICMMNIEWTETIVIAINNKLESETLNERCTTSYIWTNGIQVY